MPTLGETFFLLTAGIFSTGGGGMRKIVIAACAAGLGIALSSATAASAWVSHTIVVRPGQSIQAAVNLRLSDTVEIGGESHG